MQDENLKTISLIKIKNDGFNHFQNPRAKLEPTSDLAHNLILPVV